MATSRIAALTQLIQQDPSDATLYYMLAHEYFKADLHAEAVEALRRYLALAQDEGAAYRLLGQSLEHLGRREEARQAYREGLAAARRHHHDPMIEEYSRALEGLE